MKFSRKVSLVSLIVSSGLLVGCAGGLSSDGTHEWTLGLAVKQDRKEHATMSWGKGAWSSPPGRAHNPWPKDGGFGGGPSPAVQR